MSGWYIVAIVGGVAMFTAPAVWKVRKALRDARQSMNRFGATQSGFGIYPSTDRITGGER